MACWRVLELSDLPGTQQVPQLLIKPSIWSEELDLDGIIERTFQQESPIEVSKQDTSQLAILLDNVRKTLASNYDATCRITRDGTENLVLHTSIRLPKPLDSLTWKFDLEKKSTTTLKQELILPLLVSSHNQHSRLRSLIALIDEKDKAITRLVDQFEASNLDLATAFPSVGGSKAGRRLVKREQAVKQIPALRPFEEAAWKVETSELQEGNLSSFELFQEALSECVSEVPPHIVSTGEENAWWTTLSTSLRQQRPPAKRAEVQKKTEARSPTPQGSSDNETEDEFETHEHFYQREAAQKPHPKSPSLQTARDPKGLVTSDGEATEDDDLDALPRSQSKKHGPSPSSRRYRSPRSPEPQGNASPEPAAAVTRKAKGFRIGGAKAKTSTKMSSPPPHEQTLDDLAERNGNAPKPTQAREDSAPSATPSKSRKTFKIGGKAKEGPKSESTSNGSNTMPEMRQGEEGAMHALPSPKQDLSIRDAASREQKSSNGTVAGDAMDEDHEETAEEKAERRRRELKRKNEEELAKKQAQKKKKRF